MNELLDKPYVVSVVGGSGFVGRHLIALLKGHAQSIRVLSRDPKDATHPDIVYHQGNIFDGESLKRFLDGSDVLINLAHPLDVVSDSEYISGFSNLAAASLQSGVARVVHTSTAMVVGVPDSLVVDESSKCNPLTQYERRKIEVEKVFLEMPSSDVDVGILRPTAVFGEGGLNLLKLASTILDSPPWQRHLLRFLHGGRQMHLVSVHDVVSALFFLAFLNRPLHGNIFNISSDELQLNRYQAVDSILGSAFSKPAALRSFSLPSPILKVVLRAIGRSQADPEMVYSSQKILDWGFIKSSDFEKDLRSFAQSFLERKVQ